jgi:7,8-dihydropterin-6-yl-methyl-4-(beta-D-ribofuranosyl)aminobenzene 5'-phosphate synthase
MKKLSFLLSILLLTGICVSFGHGHAFTHAEDFNIKASEDPDAAIFTILYDNYRVQEETKTAWGFSCLIEYRGKKILFDTGGDEKILKHNIEKMNIDLTDLDAVVISHDHWDHVGAINYVLSQKSDLTVYLPTTFKEKAIEEFKNQGANVVIVDKPLKIEDKIRLTGTMMNIEQSMIIDTPKGLVILTGCSHQGIVDIIRKSQDLINKDIYLVFGGLHLLRHSEKDVDGIITDFKKYKVKKCGATYCTGDSQINQFKKAYGENYVKIGTGRKLLVAGTK